MSANEMPDGSSVDPEHFCDRCGGLNCVWFVDSDRWNTAVGVDHRGLILCPSCFVLAHEQATGMGTVWKLVPDVPFKWIEAS